MLEHALDWIKPGYTLVTHEQNIALAHAGKTSLFKIHGSVSNIEQWTLNQNSYQQFADQYPFLDGKLNTTLLSHSIVFIGCSMVDPRLVQWYQFCEA